VAPERVSAGSWNLLERLCNHERERHELPAPSRWFATLTPWGTALYDDDDARLMAASAVADQSAAFRALRELAPHDRRIVSLADPGDEASPEATAALYGPLAEYDLTVLRKLAWSHRQDPSAAVPLYEKAVQMDPGGYLPLGSYLADQYRDEEAAAAYEKAIAKARDRVAVSHYALWLVGHYCDMGRLPRAREVAQMAADTGSAPGLEAMGYFAERMGRPAEAEAWYQKVAERYGDRRPLDQFYMRYAHRFPDGRFNTEARSALAALFPAGLERVSLVDFTEPPKPGEGVRVTGRSQRSTRFGLRKDDIVVALNGYRVGNDEQYATLWTFDDGPAATVIVWRDARYVEIKGELRGTRYEPVARPI
jgi:tetratricopeptide (TPR) repeat protein